MKLPINQKRLSSLLKLIQEDRSKAHRDFLIDFLNSNPPFFTELIFLAFGNDPKVRLHASWVMDNALEQHPHLMGKLLPLYISLGIKSKDWSVNRAWTRSLTRLEIPEELQGQLMDLLFGWLLSSEAPIAVKAHSMEKLYQFSLLYPEIKNELKAAITSILPYGSAGIKSKGRKILGAIQ